MSLNHDCKDPNGHWQQDDSKTIDFFTGLADEFGDDVRTLNWGSKTSQENRFAVLASIGNLANKSILDVGCGLGDFYAWLQGQQVATNYHGIDITPKLIGMAKKRFPIASFDVGGLMDSQYPGDSFDFVFASGIFYLRQHQPFDYMRESIVKMFGLCRIGVAFNSLSGWSKNRDSGEFYADPDSVIEFCRALSPRLAFRHDYHPCDFTVYLYKEGYRK